MKLHKPRSQKTAASPKGSLRFFPTLVNKVRPLVTQLPTTYFSDTTTQVRLRKNTNTHNNHYDHYYTYNFKYTLLLLLPPPTTATQRHTYMTTTHSNTLLLVDCLQFSAIHTRSRNVSYVHHYTTRIRYTATAFHGLSIAAKNGNKRHINNFHQSSNKQQLWLLCMDVRCAAPR